MKYKIYTLSNTHTITAQEVEAPERDGYLIGVDLAELSRRANEYRRNLRGLSRALWNEAMDFYQVFADFDDNVRIGLRNAWAAGALECGIAEEDLTPEELTARNRVISSEVNRIFGFLDWIVDHNKASGGKFRPIKARADMWALRWDDVFSRARLMACSNQKFLWDFNALGVTKDPCNTCEHKLAGKVKRASFWARVGVQPQNPPNSKLDCEGWG